MKKIILTVLLAVISFTLSFGQTDKEDITATFNTYFKTMEQKDHVKTIEFLHPDIFGYFSKEQMVEAMEMMFNDPLIEMKMEDAEIKNISKVKTIKGIKYAVVSYTFKMTTTYIGDGVETEGNLDHLVINTGETKPNEKEEGNEELKQDFSFPDANLYAVKDPKFKGWKFIRKTGSVNKMVSEIIPSKVLKKLK